MQICFKIIKYTIVSFFVSSILSVVALRWLPVSITPLMVIRCVQHLAKGEPMAIHHKWVSLDSISPYLPVAVMASEDQNFYIIMVLTLMLFRMQLFSVLRAVDA